MTLYHFLFCRLRQKCTKCNFSTGIASHVRYHIKTHTGEKPNLNEMKQTNLFCTAIIPSNRAQCSSRPTCCTPCNKSFTQACKMTEHLFIQRGEKPPCCGECKKSFSQTETLSRHFLIHFTEIPNVKNTFVQLKSHSCTECNVRSCECADFISIYCLLVSSIFM